MKQWVLTRGVLIGGVFLAACGPTSTKHDDEVTGEDLAALAEGNVEQALRGAHRAGSFLADSATIADSLGSLAGTSEDCFSTCDASGCVEDCTTYDNTVTVADLQQSRDDMSDGIDSLVKQLKEKVFTKENLESEGGGSVTYLLGPNTLCGSSSSSTNVPPSSGGVPTDNGATDGSTGAAPELDPDCVDQATRWQPRLRLSSPSSGNVDVELLLTSAKLNPVTLELYRDHVALVLDLGAIKQTLDAAGEDTGSLDSLSGRVSLAIKKNRELDYSLSANVLADIGIGYHDDFGEQVMVSIGKSVPTFELRLDGNARQITGTLDVGPVGVKGPLNAFRDTFDPEQYDVNGDPIARPLYQGALDFLLAGMEGGVTFDGSTDQLTLQHLGLGDASSTLKVDGNTLVAFDLNPEDGRHFDMTIAKGNPGTVVSFSPTLDASLLLNFAPLSNQITNIAPGLMNDLLHFWFDGKNPSVQAVNNQLKVLSGTLNYTNTYDPSLNVKADAGQCIASAPADTMSSNPSSALVVQACQ
jgi:hypothetical protein